MKKTSFDLRLESGAIGRVWEIRENCYGWAHPDGSQGAESTWQAASAELEQYDAETL